MTASVKSEVDRIVDTLKRTGLVTKIILFGSCARGEETPDSDIDLCVLTSVEAGEDGRGTRNVGIELRRKLFYVAERSLDIITYNQDVFRTKLERPRSFPRHIAETGVVLYE